MSAGPLVPPFGIFLIHRKIILRNKGLRRVGDTVIHVTPSPRAGFGAAQTGWNGAVTHAESLGMHKGLIGGGNYLR
ncbi:hypothetical protein, partial [Acinetobacter baumannii]|uniref:hypothetical protein n=1 Tax=Acinetobacter baumannii TaxID=470 RepID=UPI0028A17F77